MNTEHLKIFLDLARTKSYTKTAKNVYLSQPAISQAIKSLEKELNIRLVDRNRNSVELTQCGQIFYNELTPVMAQFDRTIENIKIVSERYSSSLSVGYSGNLFEIKNMFEVHDFIKAHPDVSVHMENLSMKHLHQYLLDGQCDIIFQFINTDDLDDRFAFFPLAKGGFSVMVSVNHPLASKQCLCFEDLRNESFIFINARHCPPALQEAQNIIRNHCQSKKVYYSDSYTLMHELVKTDLGIAVLPEFLDDDSDDIRIIPLDYDVAVTYGMTILKGNPKPIVQTVIKEMRAR